MSADARIVLRIVAEVCSGAMYGIGMWWVTSSYLPNAVAVGVACVLATLLTTVQVARALGV